MENDTNKRTRINTKKYLLYLIIAFYPILINAQPPDTLKQKVRLIYLDTSDIEVINAFNLKTQFVEASDKTKKLSVLWRKKMPYWFEFKSFQRNNLLFSFNFMYKVSEKENPFVIDLKTGNKLHLEHKNFISRFENDSVEYLCYSSKREGYVLKDLQKNKLIKHFKNIPEHEQYIFFPKDIILYQEKIKGKGRMNPYKKVYAYNINSDSILWSKDEVHSKLVDIVDGEGKYEYLGDYNYIKDWRVTDDYLIIDGAFPGSPRRLYFFNKYSFTIKKAYPYPGKYYYKFHGDTLYWFVKSENQNYRMYAVDYKDDKIYWGLKRKRMNLNFKGDYLVFKDGAPGVIFVNRKTGKPVKRINTTDDFHLTSFDYLNGNIISTISSKDYMPRMSRDIKGYHDVLIDVSSLKQYKLEELGPDLCEECIQPKDPVDCVNQLKYLNIHYKDYIYAELKCGEYYYLLCLKIEDIEGQE